MLGFAALFAVLAVLGMLAGQDIIGQPVGCYSIHCYGWALAVNAAALAALFLIWHGRAQPRRP